MGIDPTEMQAAELIRHIGSALFEWLGQEVDRRAVEEEKQKISKMKVGE